MGISTKDIPTSGGGGVSKTLQPGNRSIKINSVYLEKFPFEEGAYNLMLDCEGPAQEDFEGFFIDKDNPALGRHLGQVGRVRASRWAFQDKVIGDMEIKRDLEIVKFLKNLCIALGCTEWLDSQDGEHETIESLVQQLDEDKPFADIFLNTCLGGREYQNKQGYTNYDLFFPKFSKGGIPFEHGDVDDSVSRVYKYNEAEHIIKRKVKEVEDFSATAPADFELD